VIIFDRARPPPPGYYYRPNPYYRPGPLYAPRSPVYRTPYGYVQPYGRPLPPTAVVPPDTTPGFFGRMFRRAPEAAPPTATRPAPRRIVKPKPKPQRERAPAVAAVRERSSRVPVRSEPVAPTPVAEPATLVAVIGDQVAEAVGLGLEEAFEENAEVGVVRRARGDAGLTRGEAGDPAKAVQDYLNAHPKVTHVVLAYGSNDRQGLREGDAVHEPLSERWRALYRERLDSVLKVIAEKRLPVIWVGAPPMRNDRLTADLNALNDLVRERVQRAGGVYADIWQGFVDEENRYTPVGPDVDGRPARLRAGDGITFTRAGARKAAHFAEVELKRLMSAGPAVATVPAAPTTPTAPKPAGDAAIISAVPPVTDLPQPPVAPKPEAGPVVPLTGPSSAAGGVLATDKPRLEGDAAIADRALRNGLPAAPRPGRADDFKWPRS
jgi:uncharacterized protein